jgi:tetratricopeptide (TPR) repeat protein
MSLDFLNLLFLPLMAMTLMQAWKERKSLWDQELTSRDRFLLQRVVVFLLLPIVVFLHECGHAAATKFFGGNIESFHYAVFWGYVIPSGHFTELQVLLIYLAGNFVQACIGFLCLLLALVAVSPPMVALLVYLGLWSAAGTLILYALLSFTGFYGDWIAIYNAPLPSIVALIAAIHGVLVAILLYLVYSTPSRLWFARKTMPKWAREESGLKEVLRTDPTAPSWLALGWCYYRISLIKTAKKCVTAAQILDNQLPELPMIQGAIFMQERKYEQAIDQFLAAANNEYLQSEERLRSLLALGDCYVETKKYSQAEQTYFYALDQDTGCGDTRYLLWTLLLKISRSKEAESQLLAEGITYWLDPNLQTRYEAQREALQKSAR